MDQIEVHPNGRGEACHSPQLRFLWRMKETFWNCWLSSVLSLSAWPARTSLKVHARLLLSLLCLLLLKPQAFLSFSLIFVRLLPFFLFLSLGFLPVHQVHISWQDSDRNSSNFKDTDSLSSCKLRLCGIEASKLALSLVTLRKAAEEAPCWPHWRLYLELVWTSRDGQKKFAYFHRRSRRCCWDACFSSSLSSVCGAPL